MDVVVPQSDLIYSPEQARIYPSIQSRVRFEREKQSYMITPKNSPSCEMPFFKPGALILFCAQKDKLAFALDFGSSKERSHHRRGWRSSD
jgi:hypothetical protein